MTDRHACARCWRRAVLGAWLSSLGVFFALPGCDREPAPSTPVARALELDSLAASSSREEPSTRLVPEFEPPPVVTKVSEAEQGYAQGLFLGEPEGERRRSLARSPVASIERGSGGRSLGFKITLEDGTVGYYKPEQSFSAAHWYSEVAAYYLDRTLGFGRVAPVVGRRLDWKPLRIAAAGDKRLAEVRVDDDGEVRGAFVWWVTEGLNGLPLGRGWEKWIRVEGQPHISPYQRVSVYHKARSATEEELAEARAQEPPRKLADEPDRPDRPAELSDIIVFDYLINNLDRWGGSFVNVRTRGFLGPLLFFDNGAGFWPGDQRFVVMEHRLKTLQRFRRRTVDALKAFDASDFRRRLAQDPLDPVLSEQQIEGVEQRRNEVLRHIAAMERKFGEQAVPW